ncbi:hypothetical protein HYX16_05680 [Candidatus Woesearchaeota archaeon]|nr:hypothetical protein [Candidatus Woesearchaeota archaeon]
MRLSNSVLCGLSFASAVCISSSLYKAEQYNKNLETKSIEFQRLLDIKERISEIEKKVNIPVENIPKEKGKMRLLYWEQDGLEAEYNYLVMRPLIQEEIQKRISYSKSIEKFLCISAGLGLIFAFTIVFLIRNIKDYTPKDNSKK